MHEWKLGVWVNLHSPFEENLGGAHHKKYQNNPHDDYLEATDLECMDVADICKRAILIHCLGTEGQCVFAQLTPNISTFVNVVSALESYFGPKRAR